MALSDTQVIVALAASSMCLDRATLQTVFVSAEGGKVIAASREKYFLADSAGLRGVNGYDGALIWKSQGDWLDLAIAGESLYALDASGNVLRFDAPENLQPPVTTLVATPASPDGDSGWYITTPSFSLSARDAETYVLGTYYRMGSDEWNSYTQPVKLPEGISQVLYYSQDSKGWQETQKLSCFSVDTVAPVSAAKISGTFGANGIYTSAVGIELSATDAVSGVAEIQYSTDGVAWQRYAAGLSFSGDGNYTLHYKAKDVAGNLETEHSLSFLIDTTAPAVLAHATTEPGLGVVYIQASDSGSGVDRIEYALDGGSFKTYGEPVVITAAGSHTVSYRAVDRAGLASATATLSLQIEAYHAGNMIQDLRFATREEGREVVVNVGVGQLLYAKQGEGDERDKDNLIKALPDYLKGANYIRLSRNDWKYEGRDFATFKAGEDMTVYIFKHKNSQARLERVDPCAEGLPRGALQVLQGRSGHLCQKLCQGRACDDTGDQRQGGVLAEPDLCAEVGRSGGADHLTGAG